MEELITQCVCPLKRHNPSKPTLWGYCIEQEEHIIALKSLQALSSRTSRRISWRFGGHALGCDIVAEKLLTHLEEGQ
jgi:hypothetical protein